jgi:hypothetical protein
MGDFNIQILFGVETRMKAYYVIIHCVRKVAVNLGYGT